MRFLAIAIIVGVAAFIGWKVMGSDCEGSIVGSEAQCVGVAGFDRAFCNAAFSRADEAVVRAGNVFSSQQDCQVKFLVCMQFSGVHGWTPKPTGFCVARAPTGGVARMSPVYDRPRS